MHGLIDDSVDMLVQSAVVQDARYGSEGVNFGAKPLWLTPREAESLLMLCAASPVSAGPGEQDLFLKLGDYFRLHRL